VSSLLKIPGVQPTIDIQFFDTTGTQVSCLTTEGAGTDPAVVIGKVLSYVVAGVLAASLGAAVVGSASGSMMGGSGSVPGFTDVVLFTQFIALTGLLSTPGTPDFYVGYTSNFAWSMGIFKLPFFSSSSSSSSSSFSSSLSSTSLTSSSAAAISSLSTASHRLMARDIASTSTSSPSYNFGITKYANHIPVPPQYLFLTCLIVICFGALAVTLLLALARLIVTWFPKRFILLKTHYKHFYAGNQFFLLLFSSLLYYS